MKTKILTHMPSSAEGTQRGSVLIITIILVLLITVLALGAVSYNSTQTRIATNTADAQVAFQTAEAALDQAESNILAGNYPLTSFAANASGLYIYDPTAAPLWTTIDWTNAALVIQSFQGNSSVPSQYIIELLPSIILPGQSLSRPTNLYRITARAVGASGGIPVILQSTVQVQS